MERIPSVTKTPFEKEKPNSLEKNYEFFKSPQEREELFNYCKSISEYLREEEIPNMVIIDRSSRPLYVGVREYFKTKYKEEKTPNIYFMNPKGFKAKEYLDSEDISQIIHLCKKKGDIGESSKQVQNEEDISKEFKDVYKNLINDSDKPVLVFDTCSHTGASLYPIVSALKENDFADVRVGTVTPPDENSYIKSDFIATKDKPSHGCCFPFGKEKAIEKTFSHVYSLVSKNKEDREHSLKLRHEIKQIMTEFLKNEEPEIKTRKMKQKEYLDEVLG